MSEKTKFSFSAVNNTNVLLYIDRKPINIPIDKMLSVIESKKINEISNSKTNIKTNEYLIKDNVYVHCINNNNEVKLNKISRFYEFENLSNLFEILPYSLSPFYLSSFNSFINNKNDRETIFYENENEKLIKRNFKLLGNKIDSIDDIELTNHLGYIIGVFLGRGYFEKKDRNLKGNAVILGIKDNFEILHTILDSKLNVSYYHKKVDEKIDNFTILNQKLNDFLNTHFNIRKIPDWFYSSPYSFLNGFLHGFFQTNGTVTFNKESTKSFVTFKISGISFAHEIINLFTNRYGSLITFSLIPDKSFCKISIKLTKELYGLLDSGFNYKNIFNENKRELLVKSSGIFFSNPQYIPYRYRKTKTSTGYNLFIPNCKGFVIGNGLFISSIPIPFNNFKKKISN
jgi:hypothetical protein